MPVFMTGDEDLVPFPSLAFDLGDGLFGNGMLDVLALGIEFTELRGRGCRLFGVGL